MTGISIFYITDREMDPRLYTYQYRRPRLANPTYLSNNVNSSLTYYMNTPVTAQTPQPSQSQYLPTNSNEGHRYTPQQMPEDLSKNRSAVLENGSLKHRYEENQGQPVSHQYDRKRSLPKMGDGQNSEDRPPNHSNLSNYGSNVLNNDSRTFRGSLYNDQEIYRKQDKKFNIITLKPNEYDHIIRQYPKLTLEDQDGQYYRKVQQQQLFKQQQARVRQYELEAAAQQQKQHYHQPHSYERTAGKPTFQPQYQMPMYSQPNAKALKNVDEVGYI